MHRLIVMTALCLSAALLAASPAQAKIYIADDVAGTPPFEIRDRLDEYLMVSMPRPTDTVIDVLSDDLPSAWVLTNPRKPFFVARATSSMNVWVTERRPQPDATVQWIVTIDRIDLTPYQTDEGLHLEVFPAVIADGFKQRPYSFNGGAPAYYLSPVPEPTAGALATCGCVALAGRRRRVPRDARKGTLVHG